MRDSRPHVPYRGMIHGMLTLFFSIQSGSALSCLGWEWLVLLHDFSLRTREQYDARILRINFSFSDFRSFGLSDLRSDLGRTRIGRSRADSALPRS